MEDLSAGYAATELKTSWLQILKRGKSEDQEVVIDHLCLLLEHVEEIFGFTRLTSLIMSKMDGTFIAVQKAVLIQLILSHDPVADQTVLAKFLNIFYILLERKSLDMEQFRISNFSNRYNENFTEQEVIQIVHLWSKCSDETVLQKFYFFFEFLFRFNRYKKIILRQFKDTRPVNSAADLRWYLPILRRSFQELEDDFDNDLKTIEIAICETPDLLPKIIKSTTYLINCWHYLNLSDLAVASEYIGNAAWKLVELIRWLLNKGTLQTFTFLHDVFYYGGIGRFLRCTTLAIMHAPAGSTQKFRKTLLTIIGILLRDRMFIRSNIFRNFFSMLSPKEMRNMQHHFDKKTKESRDGKQETFFENIRMKGILESVIQNEQQLQPLSREDAKIIFIPEHVGDALDSLPEDAVCSQPMLGCLKIIKNNRKKLSATEWPGEMIEELIAAYAFITTPRVMKY